MLDDVAERAEAEAVFGVDAIDEKLVGEVAAGLKDVGGGEGAGGYGDFKLPKFRVGGGAGLGKFCPETAVLIMGYQDGEVIFGGAGGERGEHGGDEVGGDAAILIEEQEPLIAEGLAAADAPIESGGDAEVFSVFEKFKVESLAGSADGRDFFGGRTVIDDEEVLDLGAEGVEAGEDEVVGMEGDDDGTDGGWQGGWGEAFA